MPNWIRVNQEELSTTRQEKIRGVDVTVGVSPYDVPEAIKGEYLSARQRFVIQFKYLGGEEPTVSQEPAEHVLFRIGKRTGRVHEIEIDVDAIGAKTVGLKIEAEKALETADREMQRLAQSSAHQPIGGATNRPIDNYVAASGAMGNLRRELVASLSAAEMRP